MPASIKTKTSAIPDLRGESRTRHTHVTDWMRAQITSGIWKPGDRLPSYNETRTLYGVHTATMEKVFAQLENEGLITRQRGKGTYVAEPVFGAAKAKAAKVADGIIGLSGNGFNFAGNSSYWGHILGGAREAAAQAGAHLLILDPLSHRGWEKADGVLVCDWANRNELHNQVPSMPMVSLMTAVDGMASVVADDEGGAFQAVEFLASQGHQCIGFLHGYENHVMRNRVQGYCNALKTHGIRPRKEWMRCLRGRYDIGARFTSEARKNMLLWLRDGWRDLGCTALLCHNDEAASGVIEALHETGFRVPQDVSVVGFDGTEYCDLVKPRLSSVELPLREIGAEGVKLLIQQIERDEVFNQHRILGTQFQNRATTAALHHS